MVKKLLMAILIFGKLAFLNGMNGELSGGQSNGWQTADASLAQRVKFKKPEEELFLGIKGTQEQTLEGVSAFSAALESKLRLFAASPEGRKRIERQTESHQIFSAVLAQIKDLQTEESNQ